MPKFSKRNHNQKKHNLYKTDDQAFSFIVEGETEKSYIIALCKHLNINISKCEFKLQSKLGTVQNFKNIYTDQQTSYDSSEIFFVYDTENSEQDIRLFKEIKKNFITANFIVNSSCVEVWLLLHFTVLHCNQFETADKRKHELTDIMSHYLKGSAPSYFTEYFIPHLDRALETSKALYSNAKKINCFNTYSEFHLLVELLKSSKS